MTSTNATRTVYTTGRITETRKAIKQAAKAGGAYHVQVDMHPTSEYDAQQLVILAGGASWREYESWKARVRESYNRGRRYPCNGKGPMSQRYIEDARRIEASGPQRRFKRDEAYEARMTAWAARFTTSQEKAA